jgi:hypothetical protein
MPAVVFRQHPNPLFHPTGLLKPDVPPFRRSLIESLWIEINKLGAILAFDM